MSKTENILLSLKYCWMLNREHIQRLHFPDRSIKAVQDLLTTLKDQGLVDKLNWGNPIRQPSMWFLTDAGDRAIRSLAAYPDERTRSRPRAVLEHDKRTLDMIVTIIELARDTGLSGIKVFREVKLNPDPKVRRPILDALVIFEVGGSFSKEHPDLVPWSLDKPLTDESLWRVCLEADNNTEANQVIAGKALSYQQVLNNRDWQSWWCERYGRSMPWVMWVAPTEQRVSSIVAHWERTWAGGQWLATTDAGLETNRWTVRANHETKRNSPIGFPDRAMTAHQAAATRTTHQSAKENTAEQVRQQHEAARKQRQEEQDARDFALPLNERLRQLWNTADLTGAITQGGQPITRTGGYSTSNPRFRPEEAETFAAYIKQQHAGWHAREQDQQRRRDERRREQEAQEKKESDARYAVMMAEYAEHLRVETLKRRIRKIIGMMQRILVLALVLGLCIVVWKVYDFIHMSPAEQISAFMHQRIEDGLGECATIEQPVTGWGDKPDGEFPTVFKAGTRFVRLGETWDSWPFPDQWVKVKTSRPAWGMMYIGWVDQRDLIPCTAE